jgi:hypothetical protein
MTNLSGVVGEFGAASFVAGITERVRRATGRGAMGDDISRQGKLLFA